MLKITITVFVLYAGKIGASKTARLIQLKRKTRQNVKELHMEKQTNSKRHVLTFVIEFVCFRL